MVLHNKRLYSNSHFFTQSQTYRFILILLFLRVLLFIALFRWRLLKFLGVLQQQGVSEAGTQEKVARLHGHHLEEESPECEASY